MCNKISLAGQFDDAVKSGLCNEMHKLQKVCKTVGNLRLPAHPFPRPFHLSPFVQRSAPEGMAIFATSR